MDSQDQRFQQGLYKGGSNPRLTSRVWRGFCATMMAGLALWIAPTTAAAANCKAPGTHPTIQAAVNDTNCSDIQLLGTTYNENVTIARSVTIHGMGVSNTTISRAASGSIFQI